MENLSDSNMSPHLSLFAALSYGIASMVMVFINKAILIQYAHSMTLLTLQQLATTLLIHLGQRMGYTKSGSLDMLTARKLLPISLFYNANVAFALASLKGVNIPMYIAIKRLTPLAVLVAGLFSGKGRPTTQIQALRAVLLCFEAASSLKVNLRKLELVPVGDVENINPLEDLLGSKVASLPMKYLGLSLGASFKAKNIWDCVVEKVEKRLSGWKRLYLTKGGEINPY